MILPIPTSLELLNALLAPRCQCGRAKLWRHMLCPGCQSKLPTRLMDRLGTPDAGLLASAYRDALEVLNGR